MRRPSAARFGAFVGGRGGAFSSRQIALLGFLLGFLLLPFAPAIAAEDLPEPGGPIAIAGGPTDDEIEARITDIFAQIAALGDVEVSVEDGVVILSGEAGSADAAERAAALASRVVGVVAVENEIARDFSFAARLFPAPGELESYLAAVLRALPLILFALSVFALIAIAGWLLARWTSLWRRIAPNSFIVELASSTVRAIFLILAVIAALRILDATALLGAFLGAAGVVGLAVGFAVRDTLENYISSIMLSLRQPFRPNDHVVIDQHEGRVIRLTSRATILMTLQGNHLRVPNAVVFKAVILNYTRAPQRRLEFKLGVDAKDDPLAAMDTGIAALRALPFILNDPAPQAFIEQVGDSNIVLFFGAWIDQNRSDFFKSRSVALATVKNALEEAGFALPEPIYRLRFDAPPPPIAASPAAPVLRHARRTETPKETPLAEDVAPDTDIAQKVEEERSGKNKEDLLNYNAPVE